MWRGAVTLEFWMLGHAYHFLQIILWSNIYTNGLCWNYDWERLCYFIRIDLLNVCASSKLDHVRMGWSADLCFLRSPAMVDISNRYKSSLPSIILWMYQCVWLVHNLHHVYPKWWPNFILIDRKQISLLWKNCTARPNCVWASMIEITTLISCSFPYINSWNCYSNNVPSCFV
jgi:hypothetical protein